MIKLSLTRLMLIGSILALTACQSTPKSDARDMTAFKKHMPKSILVLPPINDAVDIRASNSFWSTVTMPIAEAGYYVVPVTLVNETFKENGIITPADSHQIAANKLKEIFGADAALYIRIKEYGSKYQVVQTTITVEAEAKLVDLATGKEIWSGQERQALSNNYNQAGIAGMLIGAIIDQVSNHLKDNGYKASAVVSNQLFTPQVNKGLLHGPRSPHFGK